MQDQDTENVTVGDDLEETVSEAVATLSEIAEQLRGLADFAADLSNEPIFEPTYH